MITSRKVRSRISFAVVAAALATTSYLTSAASADVIASWTFETAPTRLAGAPGAATTFTGSGGAISADSGTGTASAFHTTAATYSAPSGNGSAASFSANNWSTGDYFEFDVSTAGFTGVSLSFDQTGSATGPKPFKIEFNAGSGWVDLANGAYNVANTTGTTSSSSTATGTSSGTISATSITWSPTASNSASALTFDLSSIVGLTGIRIVDNGTAPLGTGAAVATAGSDRVDNVTFTGTAAAPEPATAGIAAVGAAFLIGRRRRS